MGFQESSMLTTNHCGGGHLSPQGEDFMRIIAHEQYQLTAWESM